MDIKPGDTFVDYDKHYGDTTCVVTRYKLGALGVRTELIGKVIASSKSLLKIGAEIVYCGDEVINKLFNKPTQCECGAEKCGHPRHSSWCPKY